MLKPDDMFMKLTSLAAEIGCMQTAEQYNQKRAFVQNRQGKTFAVLGDTNAGKSTVANIIVGSSAMPVSMVSSTHEAVLQADIPGTDARCIEVAIEEYEKKQPGEPDCVLWEIDAALFLLSAAAPLSARDVAGIRTCIAYGIPCTIALNKMELLTDEDKAEAEEYVKMQLSALFGTDELTIIRKDDPAMGETLRRLLFSHESVEDVKEMMLCMGFASAVKNRINALRQQAKQKMHDSTKNKEKDKIKAQFEETRWQEIEIHVKMKNNEAISMINRMREKAVSDISSNLVGRMTLASSKKDWWNKQLERDMAMELQKITGTVNHAVSEKIVEDRQSLIANVEKAFGVKLHSLPGYEAAGFRSQYPPEMKSTDPEKMKRMAFTGLVLSSAALAASILFAPAFIISGMAIFSASMLTGGATAATVATGFWTAIEHGNSKEKLRELEDEIRRYVVKIVNENFDALVKNVNYIYSSLLIAVQDAQMAASVQKSSGVSEEEKRVGDEFKRYSSLALECDAILNEFMAD